MTILERILRDRSQLASAVPNGAKVGPTLGGNLGRYDTHVRQIVRTALEHVDGAETATGQDVLREGKAGNVPEQRGQPQKSGAVLLWYPDRHLHNTGILEPLSVAPLSAPVCVFGIVGHGVKPRYVSSDTIPYLPMSYYRYQCQNGT